jgi:hypothetical protein
MDKTILNAVVTLRNQVSPWLMILQVVPDGWEFPGYVPGQITSCTPWGAMNGNRERKERCNRLRGRWMSL